MDLLPKQLLLIIFTLLTCLVLNIQAYGNLTCTGGGFILIENTCFRPSNNKVSYERAEALCKRDGLVLARFNSLAQLTMVATRTRYKPIWVGADDIEHEGRFLWTADKTELKKDSPLWYQGEPNDDANGEDCVTINNQNKLNDIPCKLEAYFLCMNQYDGPNDSNVVMSRYGPRGRNGQPVCSGQDTKLMEDSCFKYYAERVDFEKAKTRCEKNDAVLAAFKSLSQMKNLYKKTTYRDGVWVGASDAIHRLKFRWLASNLLLRNDSPMWAKGTYRNRYVNTRKKNCVMINKEDFLDVTSCFNLRHYICMYLYSDVLSVMVNGRPTERNFMVHTSENSSLTVECLANNFNSSMNLSITYNDHVITSGSNQSRLVYDVANVQCKDKGRYTCIAQFPESELYLDYSIFIQMDCPLSVTLFVNQTATTHSEHLIASVGSVLNLTCIANNTEEFYQLDILKRHHVLKTLNNTSNVYYNITVTNCKDSAVYACRYHELKTNIRSTHFFMIVENCPIHILSFKAVHPDQHDFDDELDIGEISGDIFSPEDPVSYMFHDLVCIVETYSRPITLLIKSETGHVLVEKENVSLISYNTRHMKCPDKGRITCELRDHIRNETFTRHTHIWVHNCAPTMCHHEVNLKGITTPLSSNATVSFCFMMDISKHDVQQIQIFHEERPVEMTNTTKLTADVMVDLTAPVLFTLKVTFVSVDVEDFGNYLINLKFNDKTLLTFTFRLKNSGQVQSSSDIKYSPFLSIGLPCVIFIALVIALLAIYSFFKKTKLGRTKVINVNNSADATQQSENQISDGYKYTTLRED